MRKSKTILTLLFIFTFFNGSAFAQVDDYESALKSYNQGNVDTAYIHVRNALQENPDNLSAKILMAEILIKLKSYNLAKIELLEAIEQGADINLLIDPLGKSVLFQGEFLQALNIASDKSLTLQGKISLGFIKAAAYRGLKDLNKAKLEYLTVLGLSANNFQALIGLVSVLLYSNDIQTAQKYLEIAYKINKNSADVWRLKGLVEKDLNNMPQAMFYLDKSNVLDNKNIQTLRALASIHSDLEDSEAADSYLDEILVLYPQDPQAQLSKSSVLKALKKDELAQQVLAKLSNQLSNVDEVYMLSQPELMLIDSMTSYAQNNWDQSSRKFQRYLNHEEDLDKQDIAIIVLLADVYLKMDSPKQALELLSLHEKRLTQTKSYGVILAGLYLQFNQYSKADYLLNDLSQLYPADTSILILQAKLLKGLDRPEDALILLEKTHNSNDVNFQFTLAIITFDLDLFSKSLNYIDAAIKLNSVNTAYPLFRARILFKINRMSEAVRIITDLYESQPNDKGVRESYALLKASQGDYKTAKQLFNELVTEYPGEGANFLALADIENKLGNGEEAVSILQKLSRTPAFRIKARFKLVELNYQSGRYVAGINQLNAILKIDRLDEKALTLQIEGYIALNQNENAKNKLRLLNGLWQGDPSKLLRLSRLQQKIQEYALAETTLSLALTIAPQAMPIFLDSIKLKIRLGKLDEAATLISQAATITSLDDIRLIIFKGDIKKVSGNVEDAFDFYFKALKQDNTNVVALIKLSQISNSKKLSKKFSTYLQMLLEQNPERSLERKILADNLMVQKNYRLAKYHYQIVLTKNIPMQQRGYALNNLAMIQINDNKLDLAIAYAKQALDALGPVPWVIDTYAWALVLSGELDEGLALLRQAYSMYSDSTEIKYHLAYTLVKLDRKQDALEILNSLIALPNDFAEKPLVENLLSGIE
ncbi:MAG: putative PEP-CTERM system TPR-repeat lipoprotein [Flavobacteriales bacterium]|jgi:putative PEP-CTERM system TPR-repeat lipoprotein